MNKFITLAVIFALMSVSMADVYGESQGGNPFDDADPSNKCLNKISTIYLRWGWYID